VQELSVPKHSPARRLAFLIAAGIGLHNFAEGLAIGQSAAADKISLAVLLVIGFGLHNATEGFGIVGPLAGEQERPSWALLGVLGLIGGGPTFVGTVVGQAFISEAVSVLFLSLAAGSILYVVIQLVGVALRSGHKEMLYWGVFLGLMAGFATDFVITAAGV
jgi:zinc transporter, ZIP family